MHRARALVSSAAALSGRATGATGALAAPPVPCLLVTQPTRDTETGAGSTPPGADATTPGGEPGPSTVRPVQYKGSELDSDRGPGLGCFRFQLIVLVTLIVVTPLGVNAGWPDWLTTVLLFATLALLLVAGQTIIFLLRLVAADRRGRRHPLASRTRTVGELADATGSAKPPEHPAADRTDDRTEGGTEAEVEDGEDGDRSMRQ
jgi:hypothetical protein